MEIIMISESKLKVMLSAEDLQEFDLGTEQLDYSNTETKRMFWDVLSRAKRSVGFDTDGHRVLVQLYPSRGGGCEMFITRLARLSCEASDPTNEDALSAVIAGQSYAGARIKRDTTGAAFGFDTMERLLAVCRRLSALSYVGESEAYLGDDRRCYLFLSDLELSSYLPLDEYSFIGEYGTVESVPALRHFVSEHARPICEAGAVACLGRF